MNNINPTIISVDTVTKFTQEDLTWSKKLNDPDQNDNNNSIYNHPHLYGNGLLKKRIDRRLVDVSEIKLFSSNTQSARRVGNKMFKEVRQDINNFGFKLKHPPIALRQMPDGTLQPANGRTRYQILLERSFTNIIADIYVMNDNEASLFGLKANAENDPAGDLQLEDVYDECCQAVENKWINKKLNDILERVEEACGNGKFEAASRRAVAMRVYNNYNSTQKVLYWNSKASINNWMKANNYIDTD
jgi:hypothetical protein